MNITTWLEDNIFLDKTISKAIGDDILEELYTQIFKPYEQGNVVKLRNNLELEGRLGKLDLVLNAANKIDSEGNIISSSKEITLQRPCIPITEETKNMGLTQLPHLEPERYTEKINFSPNIGTLQMFEHLRNWFEVMVHQAQLKFYNQITLQNETVYLEETEVKNWSSETLNKINSQQNTNNNHMNTKKISKSTITNGRLEEITNFRINSKREKIKQKTWTILNKNDIAIGYVSGKKDIDIVFQVPLLQSIQQKNMFDYRINLKTEYQYPQTTQGVENWELSALQAYHTHLQYNNINNMNINNDNGNIHLGQLIHDHSSNKGIIDNNNNNNINNNNNNNNNNNKRKNKKLSLNKRKSEETEVSNQYKISKTDIILRYKQQHLSYHVGAWKIDIVPINTYVDLLPSEFVHDPSNQITDKYDEKYKIENGEYLTVEIELDLKHASEILKEEEIILSKASCLLLLKEMLLLPIGFNIQICELHQLHNNNNNNNHNNVNVNNNNKKQKINKKT